MNTDDGIAILTCITLSMTCIINFHLPQTTSESSIHGMLPMFPCMLSSEMELNLQTSYPAESLLIHN